MAATDVPGTDQVNSPGRGMQSMRERLEVLHFDSAEGSNVARSPWAGLWRGLNWSAIAGNVATADVAWFDTIMGSPGFAPEDSSVDWFTVDTDADTIRFNQVGLYHVSTLGFQGGSAVTGYSGGETYELEWFLTDPYDEAFQMQRPRVFRYNETADSSWRFYVDVWEQGRYELTSYGPERERFEAIAEVDRDLSLQVRFTDFDGGATAIGMPGNTNTVIHKIW